jgi:hypothetical protein
VSQAFAKYKEEMVMDQAEEERLEKLQKEREKIVGVFKEDLVYLP